MATLHWFFSLGTQDKEASYVLTHPVADRLAPVFPGLYSDRSASGRSATAGLLSLLGPPSEPWNVRFHLLATAEVVASGGALDRLITEAPDWAKALLQATDRSVTLGARDAGTARQVVERILRDVADGDAAFFETTSGLRPFTLGVLLAQPVLRARRPGVTVLAAVYAEWMPGSSPIYDHTELLDLPLWATAATALRRRLDGSGLAELLRPTHPDLSERLDEAATALDLGWPDDLIDPLSHIRDALPGALDAATPGHRAVLEEARSALEDLTRSLPEPRPALNLALLRFHLRVAKKLADGARSGDALRVLREAMVDAMVLAMAGTGNAPAFEEWTAPKRRGAAELALFRSGGAVTELWLDLGTYRNAVSHARSSAKHQTVDRRALAGALGADDQDLFIRLDDVLFDGETLRLRPPATPKRGCVWFVAVDRSLPAVDPSRCPRGLSLPHPKDTYRVNPAKQTRGAGWATNMAKKAAGAGEVVLFLPEQLGDVVLLAQALRESGARSWAWTGSVFVPLFEGDAALPPRRI